MGFFNIYERVCGYIRGLECVLHDWPAEDCDSAVTSLRSLRLWGGVVVMTDTSWPLLTLQKGRHAQLDVDTDTKRRVRSHAGQGCIWGRLHDTQT